MELQHRQGVHHYKPSRQDRISHSRPAVTKAMNALRRRGVLDYRRELICVIHIALESAA